VPIGQDDPDCLENVSKVLRPCATDVTACGYAGKILQRATINTLEILTASGQRRYREAAAAATTHTETGIMLDVVDERDATDERTARIPHS